MNHWPDVSDDFGGVREVDAGKRTGYHGKNAQE